MKKNLGDRTHCNNDECPMKHKCLRFTADKSEHWYSMTAFTYDNGCDFFIFNI